MEYMEKNNVSGYSWTDFSTLDLQVSLCCKSLMSIFATRIQYKMGADMYL
jgi:hypothetical protein